MDKTTDLMMKNIEDPNREGSWDSRGLVVGSVQSGKTSNFIGFLNKAIDAGYKKIIVLSGLNNNLRQQTQKRIDEGLLAYDTQASSVGSQIYAGPLAKKRLPLNLKIISCGTNSKIIGDFKTTAAQHLNFHTDDPSIFVVKKNKTVLENLAEGYLDLYEQDKALQIYNKLAMIDSKNDKYLICGSSIDTDSFVLWTNLTPMSSHFSLNSPS